MLSDTTTTVTFTVPIIDDGLFENNEMFTVLSETVLLLELHAEPDAEASK